VTPAVGRAWKSFWTNRDGIQDELVATWAWLAHAFASNSTIAGYDLINEPDMRSVATGERHVLASYYQRLIPAIRRAESQRQGGFHHLAFFEPGGFWPRPRHHTSHHLPAFGFTRDANVVFAPHLYAGSISTALMGRYRKIIRREAEDARDAARAFRTTVWAGEWGWYGNPLKKRGRIAAFARQQDARLWGGAWYLWKQACGSPSAFSDGADSTPSSVVGTLNRFRCPGGKRLRDPSSTLQILARPYPRLAPGHLHRLRSRWGTDAIRVRGHDLTSHGSPRFLLWFPRKGKGRPRVGGVHLSRIRIAPAHGGWFVSGRATRRYSIHGGYGRRR
jgi:hypothetical protein